MPKVVGGFFNTFSFQDFSLDVLMDFRFGGHVDVLLVLTG